MERMRRWGLLEKLRLDSEGELAEKWVLMLAQSENQKKKKNKEIQRTTTGNWIKTENCFEYRPDLSQPHCAPIEVKSHFAQEFYQDMGIRNELELIFL